jgi:HAD superfamily hydrolase (TIGR01509 family)
MPDAGTARVYRTVAAIRDCGWPGFFDGTTGLFLSYQMGCRKPDEAIYLQMLEQLGAEGKQCIFIDDRPENIETARAAGIHAHQFIPENHAAINKAVGEFFW